MCFFWWDKNSSHLYRIHSCQISSRARISVTTWTKLGAFTKNSNQSTHTDWLWPARSWVRNPVPPWMYKNPVNRVDKLLTVSTAAGFLSSTLGLKFLYKWEKWNHVLVGGFNQPNWKIGASQMGSSSPSFRGVNSKNIWVAPLHHRSCRDVGGFKVRSKDVQNSPFPSGISLSLHRRLNESSRWLKAS